MAGLFSISGKIWVSNLKYTPCDCLVRGFFKSKNVLLYKGTLPQGPHIIVVWLKNKSEIIKVFISVYLPIV